jgi:hypothetical protein
LIILSAYASGLRFSRVPLCARMLVVKNMKSKRVKKRKEPGLYVAVIYLIDSLFFEFVNSQ